MKNTHKNSSHKALSSLQQEVVIPLFFEKGEDNFPLQSNYQLLSSLLKCHFIKVSTLNTVFCKGQLTDKKLA